MRRREFITLLGGAAAWPLAARAQPTSSHPLIGVLSPLSSASAAHLEAFRAGLRELGYVEGRNITIELRFAEGVIERLPELAAELVALKPAVIVAGSPPAALAARNVTRTIPIVINSSENPVVLGLAASLARPGGNITGFWWDDEGLTGKRFELLKEVVPGTTRVGIILNPNDASDNNVLESLPALTRALDLTVRSRGVHANRVRIYVHDCHARRLAGFANQSCPYVLQSPRDARHPGRKCSAARRLRNARVRHGRRIDVLWGKPS